MNSQIALNNSEDKAHFLQMKEDMMQRFYAGQARLEFSEKKHLDGSIEKSVNVWPITLADKIGFWSSAMIRSFMLVFLVLISIEIYKDIQAHRESNRIELLIEMKNCGAEFELNQCEENYLVESMNRRCSELEVCMSQDVEVAIRKQQIWLQVVGNSFENLFNQLSLKSACMLILLSMILSMIIFKK